MGSDVNQCWEMTPVGIGLVGKMESFCSCFMRGEQHLKGKHPHQIVGQWKKAGCTRQEVGDLGAKLGDIRQGQWQGLLIFMGGGENERQRNTEVNIFT